MKGKKLVSVFLSALLLSSCTLTEKTPERSEDPRKQIIEETTDNESVVTTTTETEETKSTEKVYTSLYPPAPWAIEPTIAYDKNSIKITAMDLVQENDKYAGLALWVENDYSSDLIFTVQDMYINDVLSYSFFSSDEVMVEKGDKKMLMAPIYVNSMKDFGMSDISKIGFTVSGTNSNGYEVFVSDLCEIDTDFEGEMPQPEITDMILVASDDRIEVYAQTWSFQDDKKYLELFFRNKTDEPINISTTSLYFNDTDVGKIKNRLPEHKCWDYYYSLDDAYVVYKMPKNETVKTITMQFAYKLPNHRDFDWTSEVTTIEVK